jgi:hypothetical protein
MKNKFLASILSILIILFISGLAIPVLAAGPSGSTGGNVGPSGSTGGNIGPSGSTGGNAGPAVNIPIRIDNPFKCGNSNGCELKDLLLAIVDNLVMPIGGTLCILAFIFAGFQYVLAQGNPERIKQAHRTLLYAAIGTALLLGAKVFAKVIENTINNLHA